MITVRAVRPVEKVEIEKLNLQFLSFLVSEFLLIKDRERYKRGDTMDKILITTNDLGAKLGQPDLVVVDARPSMSHLLAHIPGAVNVNWREFSDPTSTIKGLLDPSIQRLEQKLGALGIGNDKQVVVYSDPFEGFGEDARIFWMLTYLGHSQVQILNGGWMKWRLENRSIERGPVRPRPAAFQAHLNPDVMVLKDEVKKKVDASGISTVIVDARSPREYQGEMGPGIPRGGHIPGSVNLAWNSFYNADGTVKDAAQIEAAARNLGITKDKAVTTYCTGGVRSSWLFFLLQLAGYPKVSNYPGSWWEWSNDFNLPVEK